MQKRGGKKGEERSNERKYNVEDSFTAVVSLECL